MVDPLLPSSDPGDESVAAADPGVGAPRTAPGTGIGGEDPDTPEGRPSSEHEEEPERGGAGLAQAARQHRGTSFPTPDPDVLQRG
ncbi:hypothetical protein [Cellulomonas marina]|uniref:Uncharacterized protein n=1 Tax=Cellulomonas marina TaxID=988821 RepID=A0A1I0VJQ7_9CELL|nr:hypothetical protein [Cellulomonas marina]GIG27963.1 hypothetical protein Cma02nite_05630 [Cellulomonas marina]SFA75796.1 hypothetical protein SAMN05421867_101399 [Cellulomonas marina]